MKEKDVRRALARLDGTTASAVALLTGLSLDELNELGGIMEDPPRSSLDNTPMSPGDCDQ